MKVTAQEEFGLRCLLHMGRAHLSEQAVSTQEIAEAEGLSVQFVGKIMASLKAGGLVQAVRGRKGGYQLSRSPQAITLDEVLSVVGGRLFDSDYCKTHSGSEMNCVHTSACTLRPVWGSIELIVSMVLRRISLADLLETEKTLRVNLAQHIDTVLTKDRLGIMMPIGHLTKE